MRIKESSFMKKILNHIFIDGLSGMALVSTLIIGTIIGQIGT